MIGGRDQPEPEERALEAEQLVGLADRRPLVNHRHDAAPWTHVRAHRTQSGGPRQ